MDGVLLKGVTKEVSVGVSSIVLKNRTRKIVKISIRTTEVLHSGLRF